MRRPRFRSDYLPVRVTEPGGDVLVVVGETRNLLVEEPAAADLAELLDGTRTLADATAALAERHPLAAVGAALRRLRDLRLLADGPTGVEPHRAAGWDARGVAPDDAERYLQGGPVTLEDGGSPLAKQLAEHLSACGLQVGDGGPLVVAVGSVLDPQLARHRGREWILVRPHGHVLLVGPHFVPGTTGCWECLRRRWQANEEVPSFLENRLDGRRVDPAWATVAPHAATVAGILAAELPVIAATGRSERLTGRMLAFDTRDLSATGHVLVPNCPSCAPAEPARPARGGADLAATYARLEHHVSRYLGIVTRLTPLPGNDDGVGYAYSAGHNFAVPRQLGVLRGNLRGLSGGKGRTELQAKVSAIGEAIERYCGVWRDDHRTAVGSQAGLADIGNTGNIGNTGKAVRLDALLGFSERQYAERDRTNPRTGRFHRVPRRLADDQPLAWSEAWSLTSDEPRLLPAAFCWYGHPDIARLDVCAADSNGSAAGGSRDEAILQGFCELVERDSVALWWYHRARRPGVDLDSFDDPWLALVRRYHSERLDRELWALDLTADLGVPTFAAVSRRRAGTEDILVGFGAHPDPAAALSRAVTEVNQFLPMVHGGYRVHEPDTVHWLTTARIAEQPWLRPAEDLPATTAGTYPPRPGDLPDVAGCVDLAAAHGLEVIVLDQSRPDVELAVVKVVVPGLRHFWRRLGPGRLWQVPADLGWGPRAADEDEINPYSVFF